MSQSKSATDKEYSDSIIDAGDNTVVQRSATKEVKSVSVNTAQSDAQWDAAQKLTAQAAEQSRIAQTRTTEAVKFQQTAEEARRAADKAYSKQHELEGKLSDVDVDNIEDHLTEVTTQYNRAKRTIADAKERLEASQREADDLQDKANELRAKQQGPAKEVDSLKAKLDKLNQQLDDANAAALGHNTGLNTNRSKAVPLEEQIAKVKKEMREAEDQYEVVKDRIADLEKQLEAAKARKERIKDSYKGNRSKLSGLESDLSAIKSDIDNQEGSVRSSQSLADQLAAKKEQTQYDLAEAEKALDNLKAQTAEAQRAAEEKLKALSLDQSALDRVKAEVASKGDDVKANQAALDKAHKDLEPLERQLDELRKAAKGQMMRAEELAAKAKTVSDEADIAQAKKEELWYKAMKAGEGADKTSDAGYMKATEAAGLDTEKASELLKKSEKTAEVASRTATRTITTESSKKVTSSSHSSQQ